MKNILKALAGLFVLFIIFTSCKRDTFTLDEISDPTDINVTAEIIGKDATHPNGDSSGNVKFHLTSKEGIAYSFDWDASTPESFENVQSGLITHRFTKNGLFTYNVTAKVTGAGGIKSVTKVIPVTVVFKFVPDSNIVKAVTGASFTGLGSRTFRVDSGSAQHLGVGPYTKESIRPEWWSAAAYEKAACCNCFYSARFTFTKVSEFIYNLTMTTPEGAFTKNGALAGGLPGIPAGDGAEGCYTYGGGSSTFVWVPASSGAPANAAAGSGNINSTQTSIQLEGNNTFVGYGATKKEYEILTITEKSGITSLYLRAQGTETGNAWYIKLKEVL